ncbi:tetratricopeptide repeat protein [Chitinimonas naiadis]
MLAVLLLQGCSGEKPEVLLASAKDYLAKNDSKAAVIQLKNALQTSPDLAEARFLLGKALLEGGDAATAEVELRKAQDLKYPPDQVVPLLARALLAKGEAKKVIDDMAPVVLSTPESKADLQVSVGQAYFLQGNLDGARQSFDNALATKPGFPIALVSQARLAASNKDFPTAMGLVDKAIEGNAKLQEAWQLKGDILVAQGKMDDAIAIYRKALEARPDSLPANAALILRLMENGKIAEAEKQLETLKKTAAKHPQTLYLEASLAYQKKNYPAARDSIQQVLKLTPENPLALQLAGAIEYKLKAYPQAEANLLKALAVLPDLDMARGMLIMSYLQSGQAAKAAEALEPMLGKIENNSNMLALAGQVFMQNGNADKAESYFAKAAALDPNSKEKRTSVAVSKIAQGNSDAAFRELEQVAEADQGTNADLALINAHLRRKEFEKALKAVAGLEKKQPGSAIAKNLRGTVQLGMRDRAAARASFEEALKLDPLYFPAAANLANLDIADKKPDDARKRFESITAKDPKNVQALLATAELSARFGGKPEDITGLIGKAIVADPAALPPRLALIGYYLRLKDSKKALSAAQDALAVQPDRPELLDAAGRAQLAAGDRNQALSSYNKLASLQPKSPQPYLHMAEVQLADKNKEGALQSLRKALTIQPDLVDAQRGVILLELDTGRADKAFEEARKVQQQRPKESVGYMLEGDVHVLRKAWPEAAAAYRAGLKQVASTDLAVRLHSTLQSSVPAEANKFAESWIKDHPKDGQFKLYLAEAATKQKDYVGSVKYYRTLLETQPENALLLNNLAWAAAQAKDPKALEYAEKAYKLAPEQPAVLDTLGVLLSDKGDMKRGLELLRKAVSLAPQAPQLRLNLAKALIQAGQRDEAKKELDTLAKLGDKSPYQAEVAQLQKSL